MKYIIFLSAFLLYTNIAMAQLTKGNWLIGCNVKFYHYTDYYKAPPSFSSSTKFTEVSLSADIGYFVMDKLVFGLKPTATFIRSKSIYNSTTTDNGTETFQKYLLGPFGRYYFLDKKKEYNILIDASYQLGTSFYNVSSRALLNTFSIAAGPVIYFNSSVGIEFLIGYKYSSRSADGYKSIDKGVHVGIGFQIHLDKRGR